MARPLPSQCSREEFLAVFPKKRCLVLEFDPSQILIIHENTYSVFVSPLSFIISDGYNSQRGSSPSTPNSLDLERGISNCRIRLYSLAFVVGLGMVRIDFWSQ